jgi:hypothetical protein
MRLPDCTGGEHLAFVTKADHKYAGNNDAEICKQLMNNRQQMLVKRKSVLIRGGFFLLK